MRICVCLGMAALLLLLPQFGFAQAPASDPMPVPKASPAPEGSPPPKASRRGVSGKRWECRQEARGKGLRGRAAEGAEAICYEEARLDCLKKVIAAGIDPPERREHLARCLG